MSFDQQYFQRYYKEKSWFGFDRGARPFLYRFWIRQLRKICHPSDSVIEVGCGLGYFLRHLQRERIVVGCDISFDALVLARKSVNVPLLQASGESMPFKHAAFHLLIAFDLVEHLQDPKLFLMEALRLLKAGGYLIISTPNLSSFGAKVKGRKAEFAGKPYAERRLEWHAWRDDSHISIKPLAEWRDLITTSGFHIVQDGTDTLWDVPYFRGIPYFIQKAVFISFHWMLTWLFGFFPWKWGENYVCIARKISL